LAQAFSSSCFGCMPFGTRFHNMAIMKACTLVVSVATAGAMKVVNRESRLCLDLHAPCVDGSSDAECERVELDTLKKGTNLQLYECNDKKNQEFELTSSGRLRNPLTDLCLDIVAPCKDRFRTPCERVAVADLKQEANIQLYTCHEDEGVLSNSFGNQKWNFEDGQMRNWLSDLCLDPKQDSKGKLITGANVQADTCHQATYQKFDFVDATSLREAKDEADEIEQKFALIPRGAFLHSSDRGHPEILLGVAGLALVAVALATAVLRTGRVRIAWQPVPDSAMASFVADE